tara:strand:- start:316 stop:975 length:660 start_codon:yes stop_codon:yes gene_type:complete
MHDSVKSLISIQLKIKSICEEQNIQIPKIIAISKTFPIEKVMPLIEHGHIHYGENKVQEAEIKWKNIKNKFERLNLHLVGKLQTNKVKKALSIFDYIHSLDNMKLANTISKNQKDSKKKIKLFVQVNIGNESQKSGISANDVVTFVKKCTNDLKLNIIGLMCLPPIDLNSEKYFKELYELKNLCEVSHLSMGMSADYLIATKYKSSFLRIGSSIFGPRN